MNGTLGPARVVCRQWRAIGFVLEEVGTVVRRRPGGAVLAKSLGYVPTMNLLSLSSSSLVAVASPLVQACAPPHVSQLPPLSQSRTCAVKAVSFSTRSRPSTQRASSSETTGAPMVVPVERSMVNSLPGARSLPRFVAFALGTVLFAAPTFGAADDQPDAGEHHAPRPEAIAACKDKSEGEACTFEGHRGAVSGTCHKVETGEVACIHPHHHHHHESGGTN
jgi:hypothetical protein